MSDTTTANLDERTQVGSVFVSNYPPYSAWTPGQVPAVAAALASPPEAGASLGLYVHIPFCRVRCKFCYFKVYTEMGSPQVRGYLEALTSEVRIFSGMPAVAGRPLQFVYFGGGTPSFISARDLKALARDLKALIPWEGASEVTFECEPGTLTQSKLEAIREIGVTRLSLGVETFDDTVLKENGRAHLSAEIYRAIPWIRALAFDQLNVDLIAGMVGETWDTWREAVRRTIEMDPDSVTIYQMELPFNTVFSQDLLGHKREIPLADWGVKREWHAHAFDQLTMAGYEMSSVYTMVKKGSDARFVYRDAVWHGSDMLGTGVASFSHVNGVHFQNTTEWGEYLGRLDAGELPVTRAFQTSAPQRLVRELILQLKLGRIETDYFRKKFGVEILTEFARAFERLRDRGMLSLTEGRIELTRDGLLRADGLLSEFYAPEYRNTRYT
ncbi:MAG TPA: coproporphyrinogen-III oxidase family protein [Candidatus Polarisedimenticolia bacterium]|jgi:oxygen-independent coproporphyrinogen-3 oxidase